MAILSSSRIKVAVGMSGGVDSSVSALLLKQQGYDVVGFFMKLWHDPCGISENACCDERALMDARKVADQLNIPFYVVDAREEFKKEIVDYFVDEYKNLRTPNPCVLCNKKIKFGWLSDFVEKVGCEKLATGHYVKVSQTNDGSCHLLRGDDESKDQSYFLYQLNQEQLSKVIFPVGQMTKTEVREIAKKYDLPTSEKKESQEVCFVAENDYREFLKRNLDKSYFEAGKIVDRDGYTIGHHNGLVNYTIGQRKGIDQDGGYAIHNAKKLPLYVVGFNKAKNELIVSQDYDLQKKEFEIIDVNWINSETEDQIKNEKLSNPRIKIRYKAEATSCSIKKVADNRYLIRLASPARAITPGQSAVLYCDGEVIGGGLIDIVI